MTTATLIHRRRELLATQSAEIVRLRRVSRLVSEITGAAAGTLNAIHRAGGYQVFDPQHQDEIQRAIRAQEAAVLQVLNARGDILVRGEL